MRTTLYGALACMMGLAGLVAADKPPATAQAQRGRQVFLHYSKGTACGTCHAMDGAGTAVGPDLTMMAEMATVHSMVATIRMTMTNTVQRVKTANGSFPAVLKQKQGDESEYWDLSQTPPALRKLTAKEIVTADRDTQWPHPAALIDYTAQEYADMIAFLRWAATGAIKEVKASEVGELQ
jgi:mono/diheme cytochrome c family protein